MIRIRQTTDQSLDARKLAGKIDQLCFRNDDPVSLRKTDLLWIGIDSETGKPACYTACSIRRGALHIIRMGVIPAYRGQGLQARMLKAVVREASKLGCSEVHAVIVSWNWPSMNNFIRVGFKTYRPKQARSKFVYWRRECSTY